MADKEKIQKYHSRAEELRTIADGMKDRDAKQSLVSVAADYDRMAFVLEDAMSKSGKTSPAKLS